MPERCDNCKFYKSIQSAHADGRCRRFPPDVHPEKLSNKKEFWTLVKMGQWCGEWVAKP